MIPLKDELKQINKLPFYHSNGLAWEEKGSQGAGHRLGWLVAAEQILYLWPGSGCPPALLLTVHMGEKLVNKDLPVFPALSYF